jgi:hypothetical protein
MSRRSLLRTLIDLLIFLNSTAHAGDANKQVLLWQAGNYSSFFLPALTSTGQENTAGCFQGRAMHRLFCHIAC